MREGMEVSIRLCWRLEMRNLFELPWDVFCATHSVPRDEFFILITSDFNTEAFLDSSIKLTRFYRVPFYSYLVKM